MGSPLFLSDLLTGPGPFVVPALAGLRTPEPPKGGTTNEGRFTERPTPFVGAATQRELSRGNAKTPRRQDAKNGTDIFRESRRESLHNSFFMGEW